VIPSPWVPLAVLVVAAAALLRLHMKQRQKSSQGRALNPDLDPNFDANQLGAHYIVLTPPPHQVVIGEHARFQHLEIIGGTGTGKNYHGLLPMIYQDIKRKAGVVILDPKGSMRRQVAAYARACGRAGHLHCLDLADPATSAAYSPFQDDDPALVAERVHVSFYSDDLTPTPFYREMAKSLFYNFFGLCHGLKVLPTLDQLRTVAMDQAALAALVAKAPRSREAQELKLQLLGLPAIEYAKIMQGLVNALTSVTSARYASLLNTTAPNIDLRQVVTKGQILYVGLAADQYPSSFKRVSTMLLMDLQSSLTKRYGLDCPPLFLYLDEFADLIYPEIRALIAKAREARVGVTLAHQSLGDLRQHGDAIAAGIFENTSNKIIFRVGSAETAEQLARLAGTKTVSQDLINYSLQGDNAFAGGKTAKGLTTVTGEEFLFHPNDLKNLGVGEAFMIVQRKAGRELHRGHLLPAPPEIQPLGQGELQAPVPGAQQPALVLGAVGPKPAASLPKTPAAEAALRLFDRKKKHGA
jgi:intracellular multiplication protein IcmO